MRAVTALVCLVLGTAAAAQDEIEVYTDTTLNPWTHLEVNNDPDTFQFAIVTDRTGGHRPGVFMDGVRKLNLMQPEFVMSVGDLIEGYTENPEVIDQQWDEFNGFVGQLEMPFFYVPGNHDISNEVMEQEWLERYGKLYYHFVYKDVLFLCLDSEDPPNSQMSEAQAEYVKQTLEAHPDVKWTLVFTHKPLWDYGDPEENGWNRIETLLAGRRHSVFAGHTHHYFKHRKYDSEYIVLATMGGGSQLRGPNFGEFDHFMWVTMTDEGPRIANLMLDGIWDTNIITEERMDIIRPVASGAAVRTDGIVVDGPAFQRAETSLRVTNDADVPMRVSLSVIPSELVTPSIRRFAKTLPPNTVEVLDLRLSAAEPVAVADMRPIRVRWEVEYALEDELTPISLSGTHRVVVDTAHEMMPVQGIVVDGALSDWDAMRVRPREPGYIQTDHDAWEGNHDASAAFSVGYDDDYVYIAVDATDDENRRSTRRDYNRQDSLLVWLDARPEDAWAGPATKEDRLFLAILPESPVGELLFEDELPADIKVGSLMTDDGYQVEIAVPISYVREKQGDDWKNLRVNVVQNDIDADGRARVGWRPEWTSPANYAGSGRFVRP